MNQLVLASAGADVARAFIELGVLLIGLGFLARLSHRIGLSPIPAYLAAGLRKNTQKQKSKEEIVRVLQKLMLL